MDQFILFTHAKAHKLPYFNTLLSRSGIAPLQYFDAGKLQQPVLNVEFFQWILVALGLYLKLCLI